MKLLSSLTILSLYCMSFPTYPMHHNLSKVTSILSTSLRYSSTLNTALSTTFLQALNSAKKNNDTERQFLLENYAKAIKIFNSKPGQSTHVLEEAIVESGSHWREDTIKIHTRFCAASRIYLIERPNSESNAAWDTTFTERFNLAPESFTNPETHEILFACKFIDICLLYEKIKTEKLEACLELCKLCNKRSPLDFRQVDMCAIVKKDPLLNHIIKILNAF